MARGSRHIADNQSDDDCTKSAIDTTYICLKDTHYYSGRPGKYAEVEDDQSSSDISNVDGIARRVDEGGKVLVSVGFAKILDEQFVSYLKASDSLKDVISPASEKGKFVFLQYLVTDHRVGDKRRGAGAALLQKVKEYAAEHDWKTIWIDCWDGGNGQLVQYYLDRGFQIMGSFEDSDETDETPWKGKLLRIQLE
ncbi:hypothetical protein FHETE_10703 [Fusarium heterosporum]|uniref:N-acetyltransferase domain-containing protein n=1 Tax=Fusarium heterosporum TaxID=42747 RepID=A0A8H5SQ34_FUSHE|nr:hypothetical protein FHETE_10703 [Fusarium heterosporum]